MRAGLSPEPRNPTSIVSFTKQRRTNASKHDVRARIADAGVLHTLALAAMLIPHKLHPDAIPLVPARSPQRVPLHGAQRAEEDADRVPPADRVLRAAQVARKRGVRVRGGGVRVRRRVGARAARGGRGSVRVWQRGEREDVHCFVVQR